MVRTAQDPDQNTSALERALALDQNESAHLHDLLRPLIRPGLLALCDTPEHQEYVAELRRTHSDEEARGIYIREMSTIWADTLDSLAAELQAQRHQDA